MNKTVLLRLGLDGLHFSGFTRLGRSSLRGVGAIFCLHQVCPNGGKQLGFSPNSKLECKPDFLESIIKLVRRRGYETLSVAAAVSRLKNPVDNQKPFAVFTLDDGYKDNQKFAQPVFQKLNCPFTIFVAPRIAEGSSELWWRLLETIVRENDHFQATVSGEMIAADISIEALKWLAWPKIYAAFEKLEQLEQRRAIRELCKRYEIEPDIYCKSVAMNWNELRAIAEDPLCTIGAHTLNHFSIGHLSSDQSLHQLQQAKSEIESQLQKPVLFNAYPYGAVANAGPRDFALAQRAGYLASVTTRKGVVFSEHAAHLQALPRIMISGRFQELRFVDAMISGLPTALSNRFQKVNVA